MKDHKVSKYFVEKLVSQPGFESRLDHEFFGFFFPLHYVRAAKARWLRVSYDLIYTDRIKKKVASLRVTTPNRQSDKIADVISANKAGLDMRSIVIKPRLVELGF